MTPEFRDGRTIGLPRKPEEVVRLAAWDIAGNGALVQPMKLNSLQTSMR